MRITFISDTHNKHKQITEDLPGGDLLIHAGDISSMGYEHEIQQFCKWYNNIENYNHKVFIAGNHDWGFQDNVERAMEIVNSYKTIDYLKDDLLCVGEEGSEDYSKMVKIWGSPWQPEFFNWAFNLPKNGSELEYVWNQIPWDTDILITHGPAYGKLDDVEGRRGIHLGCELLEKRINTIARPKIHVCGHIHSGYGYYYDGQTHYFNASVLDERYNYSHKPFTVDWNPETNEIVFL
jgi:Icc-related predicted phosphoesterase